MAPRIPEHTPNSTREAQLLAHRPLVNKIARRVGFRLPANVEFDDLVQVGMMGLDEAIARFEADRGASFDTYAARRIEGAMLDSLRAADTLTREARSRLREVRAAVQRLEHRLGRAPRAKEVSNELGWTLQAFHDCMVDANAGGARAGDEELENMPDESSDDAESTSIDEHADPFAQLQRRHRHAALNAAFDALEDKERRLMEMIYDQGASRHDAGACLGVSASMVSRMHTDIVLKLKRRLRDW